jgi:phosphoglycerol transferase MdoB-like AlkP superfamily enzyme
MLNDSALQHEVISPLYQLDASKLYRVSEGRNQFKYLTQAGEFREITGYLFHSYQAFQPWVKQKSIFIKKQQEGYHVIGLHGFTSEYYKRKDIWPALGIQESMFAEDFRKLSLPLCGTIYFQGICDTAVTTWLFKSLRRQPERKEFYYWVTLSNHLPIVEIHDEGYNLFAAKWKKKGMNENVLQMAYRHQLLFKDIAHKMSQPGLPKSNVLLVGDHAPPFIDPADRAQYDAFHVQYVELAPN